MNQTWENTKPPNFGPDFGLFDLNLGPQIFVEVYRKTNQPNLRK